MTRSRLLLEGATECSFVLHEQGLNECATNANRSLQGSTCVHRRKGSETHVDERLRIRQEHNIAVTPDANETVLRRELEAIGGGTVGRARLSSPRSSTDISAR